MGILGAKRRSTNHTNNTKIHPSKIPTPPRIETPPTPQTSRLFSIPSKENLDDSVNLENAASLDTSPNTSRTRPRLCLRLSRPKSFLNRTAARAALSVLPVHDHFLHRMHALPISMESQS